jgi:hypothetical protein
MADQHRTLTTRQGHPVTDNQSLRSVGERGPATLENYQFIEKITHFDREGFPNASCTRAVPVLMGISKRTEKLARSPRPGTPVRKC